MSAPASSAGERRALCAGVDVCCPLVLVFFYGGVGVVNVGWSGFRRTFTLAAALSASVGTFLFFYSTIMTT